MRRKGRWFLRGYSSNGVVYSQGMIRLARKGRLTKWPGPTKWPRRTWPPTCARVGSRSVARTPYVRRTNSYVRRTNSVRAAHVASHVRARRLAVRARAPRCALPPSHVRLDSVRSSAMGAPLDLPGRPGTFLQSIEEYADSIHGRATAIAPIILTAPAGRVLETSDIPERRCRMVHGAIRLSRARVPPYCALIWRPFPSA